MKILIIEKAGESGPKNLIHLYEDSSLQMIRGILGNEKDDREYKIVKGNKTITSSEYDIKNSTITGTWDVYLNEKLW